MYVCVCVYLNVWIFSPVNKVDIFSSTLANPGSSVCNILIYHYNIVFLFSRRLFWLFGLFLHVRVYVCPYVSIKIFERKPARQTDRPTDRRTDSSYQSWPAAWAARRATPRSLASPHCWGCWRCWCSRHRAAGWWSACTAADGPSTLVSDDTCRANRPPNTHNCAVGNRRWFNVNFHDRVF